MDPSASRKRPSSILPAIACGLIIVCLSMFPGDAPWGGDDVLLINSAIKANHEHRLITAGLGGSFGYPYGPIPSQIYQLLALISHNPITLVSLHASLFAAATAIALLYLADVLNVSPWLAPLTMLGPFFWFYTRLMWDNTFAIPVGTLLLASYGDFLRRCSGKAFLLAAVCAVSLPLIHPMTLPLVIAMAGHAICFNRTEIKKRWRGLLAIAICAVFLAGPYVQRVSQQVGHSAALIPPRSDALRRGAALAFPLYSGRLFCAYGFFDDRGPEIGWEQNRVVASARVISLVAYPLIWLGMQIGLRRKNTFATLCVVALVLQSLMDAALRISPYPHYYTGTWAACVVLMWLGIDCLKIFKLRWMTACVYGLSLIIATIAFARDIHKNLGGGVWYGPSLATQIRN